MRPVRDLLVLATPLVLVSLSRMLMGFIDFVMVSQLGTEATAAISPATLVVWAIICLGVGSAQGVQTFASQADGRGEPRRAAPYVWQVVYLAGLGALCVAALSPFVRPAYEYFGTWAAHPPAVRAMEADYTAITIWAILPATIASGLESFFNGVKRTGVTLVASVVCLIVNVIFNYLLIWGMFGFPELGIYGAGLATVIGWWARVLVLGWVFLSPSLHQRYGTRAGRRLDLRRIREVLALGAPIGLAWLADIGSWTVFLNVINPQFGQAAMAATGIALQYTHLAFMPAVGIGMALCSQVGFCIGARKPAEAEARVRVALGITMVYMGAVGAALFLLRDPAMRIMTHDPAVIEAGVWILICVALYQVFDAMSITFIFALRGAGDTKIPALLNGGCCWVIFVGGGALVPHIWPHLEYVGPWIAAVTYLSLLGLLLLWRYRAGPWRSMQAIRDPAGSSAGSQREALEEVAAASAV